MLPVLTKQIHKKLVRLATFTAFSAWLANQLTRAPPNQYTLT